MIGKANLAKFSILIIVLLIGLNHHCHAQYYWEESNRLGIKIAPTIERFNTSSSLRSAEPSMLSYSIGVFAIFPIKRTFSIQAELLWHQKGGNFTSFTAVADTAATTSNYRLRMGFLEVPVLASWVSGPLQCSIGPYIAYRVSFSSTGFQFKDTLTAVPSSADFIKLDYGIVGDVSLRNDVYIVGLRGQYGIPKIATTEIGSAYIGKAHYYSGAVYLGFMF